MTAVISHTSFDSLDANAMSVFWGKVLGFTQDPNDPNEPGDEECMIFPADGAQRLLFIEVPDAKRVKNRLHLDLMPAEGIRDEELQRLLGLGARTWSTSTSPRKSSPPSTPLTPGSAAPSPRASPEAFGRDIPEA